MTGLFERYQQAYKAAQEDELSLNDYLALCKTTPLAYATPHERMLKAIGEPKVVDTRHDPRLSRIYLNRVIRRSRHSPSFTAWKTWWRTLSPTSVMGPKD